MVDLELMGQRALLLDAYSASASMKACESGSQEHLIPLSSDMYLACAACVACVSLAVLSPHRGLARRSRTASVVPAAAA